MEIAQSQQPSQNHKIDLPFKNSRKQPSDKLRVLKIQRTCVYDGPGIRTVIFFQGCALRCLWCQNPEALSYQPDIAPDGTYSISDIMEVVSRDKEYYYKTGGGVTLSGGDPLLQDTDSLVRLLKMLKKEKIHVSVETSLHAPWDTIVAIAPYVDLFLVDLKVVGDDGLHLEYTGQDSRLIHGNIRKLIALHAAMKFRMVMVPGLNDTERIIHATADFLKSIKHDSIELLKYHNMYEDKARRLGLVRESLNITPDQSLAAVQNAVESFKSFRIKAECFDLDSTRTCGGLYQTRL